MSTGAEQLDELAIAFRRAADAATERDFLRRQLTQSEQRCAEWQQLAHQLGTVTQSEIHHDRPSLRVWVEVDAGVLMLEENMRQFIAHLTQQFQSQLTKEICKRRPDAV